MTSGDLGTHCCAAGKVAAGRLSAGKSLPACQIFQQWGGIISNTAAQLIEQETRNSNKVYWKGQLHSGQKL